MKLASALIVDEIQHRDDGSINLLGLREDLFFDALPVLLETLSLFLELEIEEGDRGKRHQLELRVVDPSGQPVGGQPIRFTIPSDYPRPTAPLDPTLFEVKFEDFGAHHVEILLGGQVARRLRLNVYPQDAAEA